MTDTILVIVEQREGKLNRVSWETITAGQAIAAATHAATAKTRIGLQIVLMGRLSLAARRRTAPVNGIRHGLQLRVTNGPCTSGQEGQLRLDYQTIKSLRI